MLPWLFIQQRLYCLFSTEVEDDVAWQEFIIRIVHETDLQAIKLIRDIDCRQLEVGLLRGVDEAEAGNCVAARQVNACSVNAFDVICNVDETKINTRILTLMPVELASGDTCRQPNHHERRAVVFPAVVRDRERRD